jgi:hypothetical protein
MSGDPRVIMMASQRPAGGGKDLYQHQSCAEPCKRERYIRSACGC